MFCVGWLMHALACINHRQTQRRRSARGRPSAKSRARAPSSHGTDTSATPISGSQARYGVGWGLKGRTRKSHMPKPFWSEVLHWNIKLYMSAPPHPTHLPFPLNYQANDPKRKSVYVLCIHATYTPEWNVFEGPEFGVYIHMYKCILICGRWDTEGMVSG